MNDFKGRFTKEGGMDFAPLTKQKLVIFIKKNPGMPFHLKPVLPESNKQRGFFEACLCPLIAFYQEGMDHTSPSDIETVREWLKIEFNGKMIDIGGKVHKIGQSTRRKLNGGFLERVLGYLIDNYAPPDEALDPEFYKDWRDRVYPIGGPDNIIDYLRSLKLL